MTQIEKNYQRLAIAVIEQAFYDIEHKESLKVVSVAELETAYSFLDGSRELEFFADISGKRNDMVNAGYIKPMR